MSWSKNIVPYQMKSAQTNNLFLLSDEKRPNKLIILKFEST